MKILTSFLILLAITSTVAKATPVACPAAVRITESAFSSDEQMQALRELLVKKGYLPTNSSDASTIEMQIESDLWIDDGSTLTESKSTAGDVVSNFNTQQPPISIFQLGIQASLFPLR